MYSCISLYSYIKPQPANFCTGFCYVVYLYIPTSNHNLYMVAIVLFLLYIFIFLHQTTTLPPMYLMTLKLYIFIFLHQTTTNQAFDVECHCCISLYSYIKPQLIDFPHYKNNVVYLYIPTSNHNKRIQLAIMLMVVYLYIPTSNHNSSLLFLCLSGLYIFIFLHQTTTALIYSYFFQCCISLYSYIKPQLCCVMAATPCRCISLYSYIKPQLQFLSISGLARCISLYSYIKPQLMRCLI